MKVLGIDPGVSGGFALVDSRSNIYIANMPHTTEELWNLVKEFVIVEKPDLIILEKVRSRPGEGHKGAFTFGMGFGQLTMALTATGKPYLLVSPQRWQKDIGVISRNSKACESYTTFKQRLRQHCEDLYPDQDVWDDFKYIQMSVCDAILISHWGLTCLS